MHYPWTVTTSHNGWQQATVDLADYLGYSYVQLAFESITPASGDVWQCDNAIDEVEVTATLCTNNWTPMLGVINILNEIKDNNDLIKKMIIERYLNKICIMNNINCLELQEKIAYYL